MDGVAVLLPVLNRPHRVVPLVESIRGSEATQPLVPMFLLSPGDHEEAKEVKATGCWYRTMSWQAGFADYAKKMNYGYRAACRAGYEWVFLGADDLEFEHGWADAALDAAADEDCCVIGTDDTVNVRVRTGHHSTHSLVHRDYGACGTIDQPGRIACEEYGHWYVDDELVQTAQFRGVYLHAALAVVRHLHPNYGYGLDDDTYRKGQSTVMQDKRTFDERKWMWGK